MQRNFGRAARHVTVSAALGLAVVASAQAPHPIPPIARPLHERAREAPLIAIGVVARVERGRVVLASEAALRGALPDRFEVKRSPLRPPPLEAGGRALLFLRGARPPYVLAGDPSEVVPIANEAEARALATSLPALLATGADLAAVRAVYAQWAASASPLLRALGQAGIDALHVRGVERAERVGAPHVQ